MSFLNSDVYPPHLPARLTPLSGAFPFLFSPLVLISFFFSLYQVSFSTLCLFPALVFDSLPFFFPSGFKGFFLLSWLLSSLFFPPTAHPLVSRAFPFHLFPTFLSNNRLVPPHRVCILEYSLFSTNPVRFPLPTPLFFFPPPPLFVHLYRFLMPPNCLRSNLRCLSRRSCLFFVFIPHLFN